MSNMKELNMQVRAKVLKEMQDNDVLNEAFLYTIPYDEFYLTQPKKENEIAVKLENIILVAKEKIVNQYGETKRVFELYNDQLQKIGTGEENEKFKADKEILESLLESQQRKLNELQPGLKIAGIDSLDNQGRIESYFELVNRKLTVMNKEQKEKYDRLKAGYEKATYGADYETKIDAKKKLDEKREKEIDQNNISNKENAEAVKLMAEDDLGFEIYKITPIEDDLFYDNNPEVARGRAFLIMDTQKRPQIVQIKNGKMEKASGFKESVAKTGEADVLRNDDQNIETRHTYGEISKYNNGSDSLSYSIELGTYGEPKLLEKRPNKGSKMEQRDEFLVREVQTNNTYYTDVNREGNTVDNITRKTFQERVGYTDDSHPDSIKKKRQQMSNDMSNKMESDFTPEELADNVNLRVDNAIEKIKSVLNEKGIEFTADDERFVIEDIKKSLEETDIIYCDDVVEKYCKDYIARKEEQQTSDEKQNEYEGRSRLNEAFENMRRRH